jgi:hypothetical protein
MKKILRSGLCIGLAMFMAAASGHASGPGTGGRRVRLDDYPSGPYLIRAVTSPTPPRVRDFNVEVRALDRVTGEVITGAEVTIRVVPVDHPGEPIEEMATHAYAPLPEEYAAHLPVETTGLWEVQITIVSPLGTGQAAFYQQIANTTALGAVLSVGAPFAGLLLLVLFFFWLQRNSGRQHTKD